MVLKQADAGLTRTRRPETKPDERTRETYNEQREDRSETDERMEWKFPGEKSSRVCAPPVPATPPMATIDTTKSGVRRWISGPHDGPEAGRFRRFPSLPSIMGGWIRVDECCVSRPACQTTVRSHANDTGVALRIGRENRLSTKQCLTEAHAAMSGSRVWFSSRTGLMQPETSRPPHRRKSTQARYRCVMPAAARAGDHAGHPVICVRSKPSGQYGVAFDGLVPLAHGYATHGWQSVGCS